MINLLLAAAEGVNLSIILDIAVCLFILIFALVGLSKGFFNCILKIFGTLGAILIAWFTAKPVLSFVNGIVNLSAICANWMSGYFTAEVFNTALTDTNKEAVLSSLESAEGIFGPLKSLLKNIVQDTTLAAGESATLGQICSAAVGHMVATVIVGVALFIIIKIIVALLAKLFDDAASKHNAINGMDKLLGLVFGLAKGILFLVVAFVAVNYLCYIPSVNEKVNPVIQNSTVTKLTYNIVTEKAEDIITNTDWSDVVEKILNKLDELQNAGEQKQADAPAAYVVTLQD